MAKKWVVGARMVYVQHIQHIQVEAETEEAAKEMVLNGLYGESAELDEPTFECYIDDDSGIVFVAEQEEQENESN